MIDFLTAVLFESLPLLLMACGVGMAVVVAIHRSRGTRASRRAIWIALAACVALLVVQRLVVTDREALEKTVWTMAKAVDDGDMNALAENLDEGFKWGNEDRRQFIESARATLQTYQIDEVRLFGFKMQVEGDSAKVSFGGLCTVRRESEVAYTLPTRWELRFVRRDGRWLLAGIELARYEFPTGGGGSDLRPHVH